MAAASFSPALRRRALLAAALSLPAAGALILTRRQPDPAALQPWLEPLLPPASLLPGSEALPDLALSQLLTSLAQAEPRRLSLPGPEALLLRLLRRREADGAAGSLVRIAGWPVTRTEILATLALLQPAASDTAQPAAPPPAPDSGWRAWTLPPDGPPVAALAIATPRVVIGADPVLALIDLNPEALTLMSRITA